MSIEQNLQSEPVTQLDLSEYTVVESGTSVRDTIRQMRNEKRNCAFIVKQGTLVGIFTDRDVLRRVVDHPEIWDHPIDEVMTHHPRTIRGDQPTGAGLQFMNDLHFRNTPVLDEDGNIIGNMTYFSLIRYLADHFPTEVLNLPPDPDNYGEERHGG